MRLPGEASSLARPTKIEAASLRVGEPVWVRVGPDWRRFTIDAVRHSELVVR